MITLPKTTMLKATQEVGGGEASGPPRGGGEEHTAQAAEGAEVVEGVNESHMQKGPRAPFVGATTPQQNATRDASRVESWVT